MWLSKRGYGCGVFQIHWPRKPHSRNTCYHDGWEPYMPFLYLLTSAYLWPWGPVASADCPLYVFSAPAPKPTNSLYILILLKTKKLLIPVRSPSGQFGQILGIESSYRPLTHLQPDSPWPACPPLTRRVERNMTSHPEQETVKGTTPMVTYKHHSLCKPFVTASH